MGVHGGAQGAGVSVAHSDKPLVVITKPVPGEVRINGVHLKVIPAQADDHTNPAARRARLLVGIRGARGLLIMFDDRVDDEFLDACGPQLAGLCTFAVGYDNIDLQACAKRGVVVTNTPDAVTEGTANMAIGLLLAVARMIVRGDSFVRSGRWAAEGNDFPEGWMGQHLCGQTMLIVGAGRIGRAVAHRALAFGLRIMYASPTGKIDWEGAPLCAERVELDDGLARADVVSLHCPLTPATRHLIDGRRLGLMRPHAIIINTARGPVIDQAALITALSERRILGAGLDVLDGEPSVPAELAALDNVVFTPHIGSSERKYRELMTRIACENIAAILKGERPRYPVTA